MYDKIMATTQQLNGAFFVLRSQPDSFCSHALVVGWYLNEHSRKSPADCVYAEVPPMSIYRYDPSRVTDAQILAALAAALPNHKRDVPIAVGSKQYAIHLTADSPDEKKVYVFLAVRYFGWALSERTEAVYAIEPAFSIRVVKQQAALLRIKPEYKGWWAEPVIVAPCYAISQTVLDIIHAEKVQTAHVYLPHAYVQTPELTPGQTIFDFYHKLQNRE